MYKFQANYLSYLKLFKKLCKIAYLYAITLLDVIACVSASTNSSNDGSDTCLSTSSLKFIEQALVNISNRLQHVGTRDPSDIEESLTGVTSLLQLSLLRELLGEYKKRPLSDNQEGPAVLCNRAVTEHLHSRSN